jgi:hypothetical protein
MRVTVSNSSKRSRAAAQGGDAGVNPKAIAAKFAAKIAAKKLEKEKQKKRVKEIKKVMTSTVMPTLYEVKALLPDNTFRFRKQYDPWDDKPIGVYFRIDDGPVVAISSHTGEIIARLVEFNHAPGSTELLSFSSKRKQHFPAPSDLTRDKILELVELLIEQA